mgnify:CR=1 FL=1
MQESILNQMTQFVEFFVERPRCFAIAAWRNDGLCALCFGLRHNSVTVVASVGQQMPRLESVNQPFSFRAICSGTFCNKYSERHTMRIHGQVYLGVEPPLVRLMPWLPPRAPAACGWTLQ